MREVLLGSVDGGGDGGLNRLLGDADPRLREGRFDLVGRFNDAGRVTSAALARNLGNDQWSVYLLNEAALAKIVRSEFCELRRDLLDRGAEFGTIADELGAGVAGSGVPLSQHDSLAHQLAAEGVNPADRGRVAHDERRLLRNLLARASEPEHGLELER